MLQHEFEKLTGLKIDEAQYEVINAMYMSDDNQTKQEFCKSFMEMGLMAHVNYVVNLKVEKIELSRSRRKMEEQRDMWRNECCQAKEKAAALKSRLNAIAEMLEGGEE